MILVCYDGSANAKDAVVRAGELFPGQKAVVLNVWEPLSSVASVPPVPGLQGILRKGLAEMDELGEEASAKVAEEGAAAAGEAGLDAEGASLRSDGKAWRGILAAARERGASVIVVGRLGASPIEQAVVGSVSAAVLRHSDRPVLLVPA